MGIRLPHLLKWDYKRVGAGSPKKTKVKRPFGFKTKGAFSSFLKLLTHPHPCEASCARYEYRLFQHPKILLRQRILQ